jgi:hypothetical protein
MFEGWASELLASYLGHFIDVSKERLRISLFSGELPSLCILGPISA